MTWLQISERLDRIAEDMLQPNADERYRRRRGVNDIQQLAAEIREYAAQDSVAFAAILLAAERAESNRRRTLCMETPESISSSGNHTAPPVASPAQQPAAVAD